MKREPHAFGPPGEPSLAWLCPSCGRFILGNKTGTAHEDPDCEAFALKYGEWPSEPWPASWLEELARIKAAQGR